MAFTVSQKNERVKERTADMQQVSDLIGGDLVKRYDAVNQNIMAIEQKITRLRNTYQNGSDNGRKLPDEIKRLEYQLDCANKGVQRLDDAMKSKIMHAKMPSP